MSDIADQAEALEQMERDTILRNHAARVQVIPMCEECEETPVVVRNGMRWRFCADCAEDHLRRSRAA